MALRILHTSDWHLGLELCGHDRLGEQERFLAWLLATCREERVDALLVAGDVYDVANPSVAAQAAFATFAAGFRAALPAASLVAVAGNHDSGARLELPAPFARALGGIHLVGEIHRDDPDRHVLVLPGPDGRPAVSVLAVPFPRASELDCRVREGETPDQAYSRAVDGFYAALADLARTAHPELPVVAMGHLALAGSARSDSERALIGGLESVATESVAGHADYCALGHIHRAQRAGADACRYSGSPLAMDFDERALEHVVLRVDLDGPGSVPRVRPVAVPEFAPLLRLPEAAGSWDDLESAVRSFDWSPWEPSPPFLRPIVELRFRSTGTESDLRRRTEELCAGLPFRLAGSPRALAAAGDERARPAAGGGTDLSAGDAPLSIFRDHWCRRHGSVPPPEIESAFREILDQVRTAGEGR